MIRAVIAVMAFAISACNDGNGNRLETTPITGESVTGTLLSLGELTGEGVSPREVVVWLPPGYDDTDERYPVLYMHDAQNLFETGRSYTGDEWEVDETLSDLIGEGKVRATVVVATNNTGDTRWADYAPQKVVEMWPDERRQEVKDRAREMLSEQGADVGDDYNFLRGDAYLKFLVEDLKPVIDSNFRTLTGPEDTFTAGSSMGGLISLYALAEYPGVFGGAACLSIHWPIGDPNRDDALDSVGYMQTYLGKSGLDPSRQRLWFDRGTETLDVHYGPYAHQMAGWFAGRYPQGTDNIAFRTYEGTEHNEAAWAARLADPLIFLLGTEGDTE